VVKPGGRIAILELGEPRGGLMSLLARVHIHVFVPIIGSLLSSGREYRYLQKSIAAFPPSEEFVEMMRAAGLADVAAEPLTFGVSTLFSARSGGR
jgi:demethylmenaquinone methyltransferase/2-methoxy-6-polyprenyl-1,4-benzoquinol methylase